MMYDKKTRLPIWRDCNLLLLQIGQAVRKFPKYHKYTLDSDLRKQAMLIVRYLARAVSAKNQLKLRCVHKLQSLIDEIKVMINLAKELKAFENFKQFQQLTELSVSIGKQNGAWLNKLVSFKPRPEPTNNAK